MEVRVKRSTLVAAVVLLIVRSTDACGSRSAAAGRPPRRRSNGGRAPLASGSDPQVRDEHGATALMYATLYASTIEMRQLLERGADVNAANATGATALMWAARDTEKTALLLDCKADVNARTKTETTPLIVATRVGNVAAMRLLIARGADVKRDAQALITEVHSQGDADAEQVLRQAGVDTRDPARLAALMTSPTEPDHRRIHRAPAGARRHASGDGPENQRVCRAAARLRRVDVRPAAGADDSRTGRRSEPQGDARHHTADDGRGRG